MTDQHPITPPPELVQQWRNGGPSYAIANNAYEHYIANQAAQWGANQELEACCKWLAAESIEASQDLRAARRPKSPSLKEKALAVLVALEIDEPGYEGTYNTIRRALEPSMTNPYRAFHPHRPMTDSQHFNNLSELHTINCAAAFALKSLDGRLECTGESEHFTYEDVAGCVYSIKRSIDMLDQIVKLQGLKGDWIYPDMHPAVEDDADLSLDQLDDSDLNPVDAMTNPYRAMCAELVAALAEWRLGGAPPEDTADADLIARARALLAQPVAEVPTDKELWAAGNDDFRANCYPTDAIAYARAVLAKWGHQ